MADNTFLQWLRKWRRKATRSVKSLFYQGTAAMRKATPDERARMGLPRGGRAVYVKLEQQRFTKRTPRVQAAVYAKQRARELSIPRPSGLQAQAQWAGSERGRKIARDAGGKISQSPDDFIAGHYAFIRTLKKISGQDVILEEGSTRENLLWRFEGKERAMIIDHHEWVRAEQHWRANARFYDDPHFKEILFEMKDRALNKDRKNPSPITRPKQQMRPAHMIGRRGERRTRGR
jgi:hypothetical protein